jgi:DNA-binding response OmpR family regulator
MIEIKQNRKNKLLLIVEDEDILVRTMSEKLTAEGFEVVKAYDGLQGLNIAESEHPDLILLDLLMPNMDGMSMLRELRKDHWGKRVPVIILTNLSGSDEQRLKDIVDLEPTYYFVKADKSMSEIVEKIREKLKIADDSADNSDDDSMNNSINDVVVDSDSATDGAGGSVDISGSEVV